MARQRYINTKFWDDKYIINIDPTEKLIFIYCLTNPLTVICGIYEITIKRIAFDTGIDKDMIIKILERFEKDNKILYRDGWLAVKNFIKNQSLNPKIIKGIMTELHACPKEMVKWVISPHKTIDSLWKALKYININVNINSNNNINNNSNNNDNSKAPDIVTNWIKSKEK